MMMIMMIIIIIIIIIILHKTQTKNVPTHRKEKIYNEQYVVCLFLQE
jgi:uncharacterized membrane protein